MIGPIISMLVGAGASPRVAKVGAWALLIGLLVAILSLGKCAYDKNLIDRNDDRRRADTAIADRKADNAAADQRLEDHQRRQQEAAELKEAVTYAPKDPAVSDDVERRLALHRCLRLQQAARAAGDQPPSCS